ncbi:MAG TPA: ferritin-like domain-containing protein [Gemmatimonadaceae bacterium]|jgi:ferritin-like metal-binding protein YciE|nr:ferritin-like domain-containing protein [Gemmatimonadaceae bacterium]
MEMESLKELYVDELKDLWSAETQITKALPKMIKAATHPKLKKAFNTHLKQTERHIKRLERIFKELDESPRGKKCVGMEGLLKEGSELIKEKPEAEVLDAGLIAAAQHVEHYEMAGYGCVRTWARQLGEERHAELLQETLDEEELTDKLLTDLAESSINIDAENGDGSDDEKPSRSRSNGSRNSARKTGSKGKTSSADDEMDADTDDELVGAGSDRDGSM